LPEGDLRGDNPVPVNVLIVDDDPSTRALLRLRLQLDERTECAGEAVNGRQAVEMAALLQPDVVILDVEMPVASGLAALPQIRAVAPNARVVIFAGSSNGVTVSAADAVFVKSADVLPNLLDAVAALGTPA
jgi:DNA-binding NarL/FixJ family response regulator